MPTSSLICFIGALILFGTGATIMFNAVSLPQKEVHLPESKSSPPRLARTGDRFAHVNPGWRDGDKPAVPFVSIYTVDRVTDSAIYYNVKTLDSNGAVLTYNSTIRNTPNPFWGETPLPSVGESDVPKTASIK